jgi:hypothetical protein
MVLAKSDSRFVVVIVFVRRYGSIDVAAPSYGNIIMFSSIASCCCTQDDRAKFVDIEKCRSNISSWIGKWGTKEVDGVYDGSASYIGLEY